MNTWNKIFSHPVGELEGLTWGLFENSTESSKTINAVIDVFTPIKVFKISLKVVTKYILQLLVKAN